MRGRRVALLGLLVIGALTVVAGAPFIGFSSLDWSAVWNDRASADATIFFDLRLARVLFATLVGAALSLAGAVFQVALRNDLATPYTLGVSTAASLGAILALNAGGFGVAVAAGGLAGALVSVALVLIIARSLRGGESQTTVLLAGVTLNLLFGSAILVVQYASDPFQTFAIVRWLMGGVDVTGLRVSAVLAPVVAIPAAALLLLAPRLNLLQLDDTTARSLGILPDRTRLQALGLASILTALVVSFAGPIGFVGLILPHAVRRMVGDDQRFVLLGSALLGAAFLVACDAIGRAVGGAREVPVGIVTALIGGPMFLWILVRGKR